MKFLVKLLRYLRRECIYSILWYFSSYFPFFPTLMTVKIRSLIWRLLGVQIGENVMIAYGVYLDYSSAKRLKIGDNVLISPNSFFLMHRRDISLYTTYNLQKSLPMIEGNIIIHNNVSIGSSATIMPNVVIGEGAVIAACSVVTKDVPPFVVVAGNPAKVIKKYR